MNMQQILNDPELTKELDKAYKLAAPYRARVQYKLSVIKGCDFSKLYDTGWILFHPKANNRHEVLICAGNPGAWLEGSPEDINRKVYVDSLLDV